MRPDPKPMVLPSMKDPFREAIINRTVQGNYRKPEVQTPRRIDNDLGAPVAPPMSQPVYPDPLQEPVLTQAMPVKKKRGRPSKKLQAIVQIDPRQPTIGQGFTVEEQNPLPVSKAPEWQREPEWKGRDLCLCFPVGKTTNPATAWTILALGLDLGPNSFRAEMQFGDAMIYHSRNKLADDFLATGATWSLWLDDDIIPPIGRAGWFKKTCGLPDSYPDKLAGLHVAHRMMEHGKQGMKVVGGLYFGRNNKGKPMFYEGQVHNEAYETAMTYRDEVRQTRWVGTGCLFVHRDVFLDIQKKFPNLAPTQTKPYWDFFKPGEVDGEGEDVAFSRRCWESGNKVHVDLGLKCMHLGWCAWAAHNVKNYLGGI